jgi:ketosteroid isomerase-like protein
MRMGSLVCLALVACASRAPNRSFTPDDDRAVRAVLTAQEEAWNQGDVEGFMAGYARTEALVFTSGAKIRRGWQETHDKFVATYGQARDTMGRLGFEVLAVQPIGADGAVVLGRWSLDGPSAGSGVFSVVLERRSGGWEVVHDHTSSDPAPQPQPQPQPPVDAKP